MRSKSRKRSRVIPAVIVVVCVIVAIICIWRLVSIFREYRQAVNEYDDLTEYAKENGDAGTGKKDVCPITVDFDALKEINEDVVAWIYIPDTEINYPVVQGEDNEYYLNHTFEGTENSSGAIFMDAACSEDFTLENTILYGHNMRNGAMFGTLKRIYDVDYNDDADYSEHPVVWILTPDAVMEYEIFAGRELSVIEEEERIEEEKSAYMISFSQEEKFAEWKETQKNASSFETDTKTPVKKPVITLSTCTSRSEDGRFIVQAIRMQKTKA